MKYPFVEELLDRHSLDYVTKYLKVNGFSDEKINEMIK